MRSLYLLIFTLFAVSSFAQNGVTIYEDINFGAGHTEISNEWQASGTNSVWSEKISSIHVPNNQIVILYEELGFKGAHLVISSDWKAEGEHANWNDQVSSIQILDYEQPYSIVFKCYLQDGVKDLWSRTNDFTLGSEGVLYDGINVLKHPTVDTNSVVSFSIADSNATSGAIHINGLEINGWIKNKNNEVHTLYGYMADITIGEYRPKSNQVVLNDQPKVKVERVDKKETGILTAPFHPIYSQGNTGVKVYKSNNFTGESRYVTKDWDFGNVMDEDWYHWDGEIGSIRVAEGWAIRCYYSDGFDGSFIDITSDWIPANTAEWKGKINSIKIIRRPTYGYYGQIVDVGIKVYKSSNFTGESKYVTEDWNFGNVHDADWYHWNGKIGSIRVPSGWAIRCYSSDDYDGSFIDITDDWVPAADTKWEGRINSIKIVRKPQY